MPHKCLYDGLVLAARRQDGQLHLNLRPAGRVGQVINGQLPSWWRSAAPPPALVPVSRPPTRRVTIGHVQVTDAQETDAAVVAVKSVKFVSNSLMIQIMRHYNLGFGIQHLNFTDIDCVQL